MMMTQRDLWLVALFCFFLTTGYASLSTAQVSPQSGAILSGEVRGEREKENGTIRFSVSKDKTSISDVTISLHSLTSRTCTTAGSSVTMEGLTITPDQSFPVRKGKFEFTLSQKGKVQGRFISPSEATGKINVIETFPKLLDSPENTCDYGTWTWSARAIKERAGSGDVSLGQGLSFSVKRVTPWESFAHDLSEGESYQHWEVRSSRMSIRSFDPSADQPEKPKGRFWAVLVWFTNKGKNQETLWLHGKQERGVDAHVLFGKNQRADVAAFRMPAIIGGYGIAEMSMYISWEGELGLTLRPGEETWMLLLFDIPREHTPARLKLKNASPIALDLTKP